MEIVQFFSEICSKQFSAHGNFIAHKKIHSGVRDHQCPGINSFTQAHSFFYDVEKVSIDVNHRLEEIEKKLIHTFIIDLMTIIQRINNC